MAFLFNDTGCSMKETRRHNPYSRKVIKTAEQEQQLKLAIRNEVARNPVVSVVQLQNALKKRGFQTANGNPLDWRYVSKLLRKLNREKALAVDMQKVNERLAETKERYRVITDKLWKIIDWKIEYLLEEGIGMPQTQDIVRAANTIVKLDLAILKAEMDAGIFDRKLGTVDVNMYRRIELNPDTAAIIAGAFRHWGVKLELPIQRPKVMEQLPPADDHGTAQSGSGVPATS